MSAALRLVHSRTGPPPPPKRRVYTTDQRLIHPDTACLGLSHNTARVYTSRIRSFLASGAILDREGVLTHLSSQDRSITAYNQTLAALKRLASESAQHGYITRELSDQIQTISAKKVLGVRAGNWLTLEQSQSLLSHVDRTTLIGKRDAAVLALLLGCGLRRSEIANLDSAQLQQRDGEWVLVDIRGKGGRIRTIGVPAWVYSILKEWMERLVEAL